MNIYDVKVFKSLSAWELPNLSGTVEAPVPIRK